MTTKSNKPANPFAKVTYSKAELGVMPRAIEYGELAEMAKTELAVIISDKASQLLGNPDPAGKVLTDAQWQALFLPHQNAGQAKKGLKPDDALHGSVKSVKSRVRALLVDTSDSGDFKWEIQEPVKSQSAEAVKSAKRREAKAKKYAPMQSDIKKHADANNLDIATAALEVAHKKASKDAAKVKEYIEAGAMLEKDEAQKLTEEAIELKNTIESFTKSVIVRGDKKNLNDRNMTILRELAAALQAAKDAYNDGDDIPA